ncbi:hypothetical protein H2200_007827 [Cladophialophora chaetospira]|uniref:Clr5 domain-containing protein n=1 Tax=Cladophialophora chaetospira TaxID=386627 RepID=A0AA38X6K2_9EURO|nr:hypothetical protein H2200_007827 [Cladophialophora chaetospira]
MEQATPSPTLEHLISIWPVASTLSSHLPVGDLFSLARVSVKTRAVLHGFALPSGTSGPSGRDLYVGYHNTTSWQRLKTLSPFTCSSRDHTKGPPPKPCRYCSRPICGACMVRDSINKKENTFPNRIRHLCKKCWETGNPNRTERYPLTPETEERSKKRQKHWRGSGSTRDTCVCTLKDDGTLCLDCKTIQNTNALSAQSQSECHGQDCTNTLTPLDISHHRICLWCSNPLPRPLGGPTRLHWNQKIIEARARNAASRTADVEEWNRQRLRSRTMTRREMRGDQAVQNDPDADIPQLVRHLDTMNYKNHMPDSAAPSPEAVFASKRGYWRYSKAFLLATQRRCSHIPPPPRVALFRAEYLDDDNEDEINRFSRTNAEKAQDLKLLVTALPSMRKKRASQWTALKPTILLRLHVQKLKYSAIQSEMRREYDFDATIDEYHDVTSVWTTQAERRKSLEEEETREAAAEKGKRGSLFTRRALYIKGQPVHSETDLHLGGGKSEGPTAAGDALDARPQRPPYAAEAEDHHQQPFPQPPAQSSASSSQPPSEPSTLPSSSSIDSDSHPLQPTVSEETIPDPDLEALTALYLPISHLAEDYQASNDDPPPYSANGWIWPGEADPPHDVGQEHGNTDGAEE